MTVSSDDATALTPELAVLDLDRSLAVYVSVLGFAVRYERKDERFAYLVREGAHLMLEEAAGPGRRFHDRSLSAPFGHGVNFQIRVTHLDTLHDSAREAGLAMLAPLEERWYRRNEVLVGQRQFVVLDPDGYRLRFFESLGTRIAEDCGIQIPQT